MLARGSCSLLALSSYTIHASAEHDVFSYFLGYFARIGEHVREGRIYPGHVPSICFLSCPSCLLGFFSFDFFDSVYFPIFIVFVCFFKHSSYSDLACLFFRGGGWPSPSLGPQLLVTNPLKPEVPDATESDSDDVPMPENWGMQRPGCWN